MKHILTLAALVFATACFGQVPDYMPTDGLLAWYPFNGNANDASGNGYHAISYGAELTSDRLGLDSSAFYFDGSSKIVAPVEAIPYGSDARSINLFFLSNSATPTEYATWNHQSIIASGTGAGGPSIFCLFVEGDYDGKLNTQTGSWQNMLLSEQPVQDGQWHMATVTYGGENTPIQLFLDGVLQGITSPLSLNTPPTDLFIGDAPWATLFFDGFVDDVSIWEVALSEEQILGLYSQNQPVYGCTNEEACNYQPEATWSDGSCVFGCLNCGQGTFWDEGSEQCLPLPSLCPDAMTWDELLGHCVPAVPLASACSEGTVWDEELGGCVVANPSDTDFDGCVGMTDLLDLLSVFGICAGEEPEEDPEMVEWSCGDPVGYHGYDYQTVLIGEQCWFAENLRTDFFRTGDLIPTVSESASWAGTVTPAKCIHSNNESNLSLYGHLYNGFAVNSQSALCPTGWLMPSDNDWFELELFLEMDSAELNLMGSRGTNQGDILKASGWSTGLDSFGFTALPGGRRLWNGGYYNLGDHGMFWSRDGLPGRRLIAEDSGIIRMNMGNKEGYSVRCIKDSE